MCVCVCVCVYTIKYRFGRLLAYSLPPPPHWVRQWKVSRIRYKPPFAPHLGHNAYNTFWKSSTPLFEETKSFQTATVCSIFLRTLIRLVRVLCMTWHNYADAIGVYLDRSMTLRSKWPHRIRLREKRCVVPQTDRSTKKLNKGGEAKWNSVFLLPFLLMKHTARLWQGNLIAETVLTLTDFSSWLTAFM